MSDSSKNEQNEEIVSESPELHPAFLMVGKGMNVQIVRVPVGTPGSGHYTQVRAKCLEQVHMAHDEVLVTVRYWNDLRKANVPNKK